MSALWGVATSGDGKTGEGILEMEWKAENSELTLTIVARTNLDSLQCQVFGLVLFMRRTPRSPVVGCPNCVTASILVVILC
jgi:hypothetical protein